jgi:hypothetical protein
VLRPIAGLRCPAARRRGGLRPSRLRLTTPCPLPSFDFRSVATGRTACGLMARCSRPPRAGFGHVIPSAVHGLPTTARVTFSAQGSRSLQARGVITRRRLPPPRLASRPGLPHEARGQGPDAVRSRSNAAGALDQRKKPNARVDLAKWCWRRARCPRWWRRSLPPPRWRRVLPRRLTGKGRRAEDLSDRADQEGKAPQPRRVSCPKDGGCGLSRPASPGTGHQHEPSMRGPASRERRRAPAAEGHRPRLSGQLDTRRFGHRVTPTRLLLPAQRKAGSFPGGRPRQRVIGLGLPHRAARHPDHRGSRPDVHRVDAAVPGMRAPNLT